MIPMPNSMEWDGAGMGPPPPPPAASAVEAVGGIGDLTHSVEQQVAASNTATQSLHPSSTSLPGRHAPPSLPTLNLIGSIPSVVVVVGAGRQEEEGNKNELVTLLATNDTIRVRGKDCVGSVWEEEGTNVDEPPSSAMMVDATGFNTHGPRMQQQQKQQQRHLEEEDDVDDEWYHERNANLSQIALVDWADYNDDEDDENWTLPTNTLMMTGLGNSMEDDDCCSTPNSISTPAMSKILVQESFIISTSSTTTNGVDSPDMMDYQNH